jgi:hypothetical protein
MASALLRVQLLVVLPLSVRIARLASARLGHLLFLSRRARRYALSSCPVSRLWSRNAANAT